MIDWKHLAAEAARLEAELVGFLASIECPHFPTARCRKLRGGTPIR